MCDMLSSLARYFSLIRLFLEGLTQSECGSANDTKKIQYESFKVRPSNEDTMAEWLRRLITIQIPLGAQVRFLLVSRCLFVSPCSFTSGVLPTRTFEPVPVRHSERVDYGCSLGIQLCLLAYCRTWLMYKPSESQLGCRIQS